MIRTCSKCEAVMERGFVIDRGDVHSPELVAWHPGEVDKRWWGLKIDKGMRRNLVSYRCTRCGFLENYAP